MDDLYNLFSSLKGKVTETLYQSTQKGIIIETVIRTESKMNKSIKQKICNE